MLSSARSVVDFGHSLNRLTKCLIDGSPVTAALAVVRDHYSALSVVLSVEPFGEETEFHIAGDVAENTRDGKPTISALADRYQHLTCTEFGAQGRTSYSLWIFREIGPERFSEEDNALAGVIVAQIARFLDLASSANDNRVEKQLYSDALDKLHVGVIMVDTTARVWSASAVAERFLVPGDGLHIQTGKLRAVNGKEDRLLQAAIRQAASGDQEPGTTRGVSLTKRSGARTLGAVVRPISNGNYAPNARIAVYVRDSDVVPDFESEFMRQIFDLTPAEAAVTRRLTSGLSLEDAATSLAISRNTARAHLRSIFSKNGISRQTELVRLVLNSAALLGERPHQAA